MRPQALAGSLALYRSVVDLLEAEELPGAGARPEGPTAESPQDLPDGDHRRYLNLNPKCEPQLGKRGLYGSLGGSDAGRERQLALLWVLNLSDGAHSLSAIARRSGLDLETVREAARRLEEAALLRPVD